MNGVKIIKRANLQSLPEVDETRLKKAGHAATKHRAVKVVADWIDEWRAAKPKDARRAFAELFGSHSSATG